MNVKNLCVVRLNFKKIYSVSKIIESIIFNVQLFHAKFAKRQRPPRIPSKYEMCGAGKAERAERSGLPRFLFGYFFCSNDKERNNKN